MSTIASEHELQGSALEPPRFSVRGVLSIAEAICCLVGLLSTLGGTQSLVAVLFLCLVLAHVLGNSLGTRLRDRVSSQLDLPEYRVANRADLCSEGIVAAPPRLAQRTRLNRITMIMTLGGALVGGTLGGTRFIEMYPDSGLAAIAVGTISSAILGAFAGFAVSSFFSVARQAIAEAIGD